MSNVRIKDLTTTRVTLNSDDYIAVDGSTLGTGKFAIKAALDAKQPIDALLTAMSALTTAADKFSYFTGVDTVALSDLTATARTILGRATATLMRVDINQGEVALSDGATINTNCAAGNAFAVTLGGNSTLANPTNVVAGATYIWRITQDGTGSRTLALGSNFKISGNDPAFVASTTAGMTDMITAYAASSTVLLTSYKKGWA